MYIHLGGDKVVQASELIAIFDLSLEVSSKISKQFILQANQENRTEAVGDETPKSLVVTDKTIYYSPISSATLKKRVHQVSKAHMD